MQAKNDPPVSVCVVLRFELRNRPVLGKQLHQLGQIPSKHSEGFRLVCPQRVKPCLQREGKATSPESRGTQADTPCLGYPRWAVQVRLGPSVLPHTASATPCPGCFIYSYGLGLGVRRSGPHQGQRREGAVRRSEAMTRA